MKLPIDTNRYCPYCRAKTKQKISVAKQRSRSTTHPLSRGGPKRLRSRGLTSGTGNKGKYSLPPIKKRKRKSKTTRRITVMYTCTVCKKSKGIKKAIRTARLTIGDKVAK